MGEYIVKALNRVKGTISVPGDKSITHRAIILGSLAKSVTTVYNYLDADDCWRTIDAFKLMGVKIKKYTDRIVIKSNGMKGLTKPRVVINAGNSGTTIRLLSGVIAGQNFSAEFVGDKSLSKRPMRRIIDPLKKMKVEIKARDEQYLPMKVIGNPNLKSIRYELPVASAQVKSCIILAGIQADGVTTIVEPVATRDHTERLLQYFGVDINRGKNNTVIIKGKSSFCGKEIEIPGDFSSAGFFIVLALILPNSKLKIVNAGINPSRTGLIKVLRKMGAKIETDNVRLVNNEPVADIIIHSSKLKGLVINELQTITNMIDEIPILCLAATQAEGRTVIRNAKELRVKESDRIKAISTELNKIGAKITELPDGFIIQGATKLKGAKVNSYNDHRIAMTLGIAGSCATNKTTINNSECIDISFPNFFHILERFLL